MALLGLDHGEKRIGIAISDGLYITAQAKGHFLFKDMPSFMEELKKYIKQENIHKIVLGLPLNMNGTDSAQTRNAREFAEEKKKNVEIPIELWDERLTSKFADKLLISSGMRRDKRKKKIDGLAAQIMLQS